MKSLLLIALLSVSTRVQADEDRENHFDDGVVHVHERKFLLGDLHEWPKATTDFSTHFMVRSSIKLRAFLDKDPVLMYQDFDIRRTRDLSFTGTRYLASQMALVPDPALDCKSCYFQLALAPSLQVEGYDTYSNGFDGLRFISKDGDVAHGFRCRLDSESSQLGELLICSVVVVYPYDTNIVLNGRRMRPGTVAEYGPNFTAIAERMLEVVTCIDITEALVSERPANFSQLFEEHPSLTDCEPDLFG